MITLLWLAGIVGFALAGWTPGLLGLIAVLLLEIGLDVKRLKQAHAEWALREQETQEAIAAVTSERVIARVKAEAVAYQPSVVDHVGAAVCDATQSPVWKV